MVGVCRGLKDATVMPGFVLLPTSMRLWARLQAGRASTADLQVLQEMLEATVHTLQMSALDSTTTELLEVRCPL
jgi:hypothetical protein